MVQTEGAFGIITSRLHVTMSNKSVHIHGWKHIQKKLPNKNKFKTLIFFAIIVFLKPGFYFDHSLQPSQSSFKS